MTLYEFRILDEMEQAEVLLDFGVYLGKRRDEEYEIRLFQIDGFYIELFYHIQFNSLRKIRPFMSTEQLNPYLEDMEIDSAI